MSTSMTTLVNFDGKQYTFWPDFTASIDPTLLSSTETGLPLIPATIFSWSKQTLTDEDISELRNRFSPDDIWTEAFLQVIVLLKGSEDIGNTCSRKGHHIVALNDESCKLPDGPYLIHAATGDIHSVARCYDDHLHALLGGGVIYNARSNEHRSLELTRYLAPSRCYYEISASKPLAGLRFAVKDVIDISGLKTSNGSRCWRDSNPPAGVSAPFVQQLVNAGAVLIGKANCTQFCDGQSPSERFEEVTPFNPRGDGYQLPSASSSGSAAAAAGYDWLDFTIGTDTGGSIRHPAGVNGVYGIRPSMESVKSSGMTACTYMDTVGVFARSADILHQAQKVLSAPDFKFAESRDPRARYKLMYPVRSQSAKAEDAPRWFPRPGHPSKHFKAESMFEEFIVTLESQLGCKRQTFNLDELWEETHPDSMASDLAKATGRIYQRMVYYESAHNVVAPFTATYQVANSGRKPFFEPIFKTRTDYGFAVTEEEYQEAVIQFATFRKWLRDVLFATDNNEIPILVYPQTWGTPAYRDESKPPPKKINTSEVFWEGFSLYSISYVSGCPDITVPIGQIPYLSRITDTEEWLPLSLSVLSSPGNDQILTTMLKDLEESGTLSPVQTGLRTYH